MGVVEYPYKCFIATPFRGFEVLRQVIAKSLREMRVEPLLLENLRPSGDVAEMTLGEIRRADFVIADLTDNNPNVTYELGYARGLEKPLLVLVQRNARVPFNVSSFLVNVYKPDDPEDLLDKLRAWVPRIIEHLDAAQVTR